MQHVAQQLQHSGLSVALNDDDDDDDGHHLKVELPDMET
jgi:hypothetical protein